jgi:hypothetical protein
MGKNECSAIGGTLGMKGIPECFFWCHLEASILLLLLLLLLLVLDLLFLLCGAGRFPHQCTSAYQGCLYNPVLVSLFTTRPAPRQKTQEISSNERWNFVREMSRSNLAYNCDFNGSYRVL